MYIYKPGAVAVAIAAIAIAVSVYYQAYGLAVANTLLLIGNCITTFVENDIKLLLVALVCVAGGVVVFLLSVVGVLA